MHASAHQDAPSTSPQVPLRLAFYTPPDAAANVSCTPLGMANEWHLIALEGRTDQHGLTQLEIQSPIEIQSPSMFAEGPSGAAVQAALVMESDAPDVFCSIDTELDRVPHKKIQTYSQQQAVLPVLFTAGATYTMTTRCINQRHEPVRDTAVRLLLYSERPMHASPVQGSSLHALPKTALDGFVSRATAETVVYGHAGLPDDCKRQVSAADKKADVQQDPTVLHAVIEELEAQRDSIASFARAELAGEIDPQLEALRLTNLELREKVHGLVLELKQAKTIAAQGDRRAASSADLLAAAAAAAPPPLPPPPPPDVIAELQRKLEEEKRQNEQLRASLQAQAAEQVSAAGGSHGTGAGVNVNGTGSGNGGATATDGGAMTANITKPGGKPANERRPATGGAGSSGGGGSGAMSVLEQALSNELQQTQADLAVLKAHAEHLELEWRLAHGAERDATMAAGLQHGASSDEIAKLKDEIATLRLLAAGSDASSDEIAKLKDEIAALRLLAAGSDASSDEIAKLKDEIAKLRIQGLRISGLTRGQRRQLSGAPSSGAPATEGPEENPTSKVCVLS